VLGFLKKNYYQNGLLVVVERLRNIFTLIDDF